MWNITNIESLQRNRHNRLGITTSFIMQKCQIAWGRDWCKSWNVDYGWNPFIWNDWNIGHKGSNFFHDFSSMYSITRYVIIMLTLFFNKIIFIRDWVLLNSVYYGLCRFSSNYVYVACNLTKVLFLPSLSQNISCYECDQLLCM